MPNWCECDLTVCGQMARVQEFLEFAKGGDSGFDFNRFIPYPEWFRLQDEAAQAWKRDPHRIGQAPRNGFNSGGYDWYVENWGTKWNAYHVEIGEPSTWDNEASVDICFTTAWSPPLPVIVKASELFPDLNFELRYFECGAQFNGVFQCLDGQVVWDESGLYFGNRGG